MIKVEQFVYTNTRALSFHETIKKSFNTTFNRLKIAGFHYFMLLYFCIEKYLRQLIK